MALRLQSKFRDNFLIQTSPPNPQKDTLGSRIGPKKTSKLFPRHFYCWRQKKLDNSKLGSTQQQKICWHWHVSRIISSQKIYGFYARKYHIVEMRGDVTDAGRKNERTTEDWASQPMEAGGWVSQKLGFDKILRFFCLRQLYQGSQRHETKQFNITTVLREPTTISLQQMQFYIGKIKHI